MTHVTELTPLVENLLRHLAKERGVSFEDIVALYPNPSEDTIEELEDEVDVARAERILATLDRSECKTLDDLRKAWGK